MPPGVGTLYLVATPIGNLEDISARALRVLGEVAFVVCEDTRHSRVLLDRHGLKRPLVSLPAFAEGERSGPILDRLEAGEDAALVTDAGTPGISDPGELLVAEALQRGVAVVPVPGPSAAVAALSASGLPSRRFHFEGFLPRKGPERRALLEELFPLRATLVFYEAPRRLPETLEDLAAALGADRRACVARELTKVHEELVRDTLGALARRYLGQEVLGEVVVLVEGRQEESRWTEAEVRRALEDGLSGGEKLKGLSTEIARRAGWSGQDVYRLGLSLKSR
ncbi:MAG TPA: 16S rRNA (cytidine(1402)-2'-O)-methyltransferase [Myxococcaceae bacterium]|jgi:16S rRNA (cytidine1402-2'-O)-methyltransferase